VRQDQRATNSGTELRLRAVARRVVVEEKVGVGRTQPLLVLLPGSGAPPTDDDSQGDMVGPRAIHFGRSGIRSGGQRVAPAN
jgi:hypothetical protein